MPSVFGFLDGSDYAARAEASKPLPFLPTLHQKLTGRGEYMEKVQKIYGTTRKEYMQQKQQIRKERKLNTIQFNRSLAKERRRFYKETDLSLLQSQLEKAQKKGNESLTQRAERRLEFKQEKADKKWGLREWHKNEDRRLDWQRQDREQKRDLRATRHEQISNLREQSRNQPLNRAA